MALLAEKTSVPVETVKVPFIVKATPELVVVVPEPPFIVRLLNVVNIVEGNVFVAFNCTVPVPGVQVLPVTVFTAMLPVVSVPPAVIVILPAAGVAAVPPSVTLPAFNIEPLENVMFPVLVVLPEPPTVTAPDTVMEGVVPAKRSVAAVLAVVLPTFKVAAV